MEIDRYACRCILCGSSNDLRMYDHRIAGYIVGWVFACPECGERVANSELILQPKDSAEADNQETPAGKCTCMIGSQFCGRLDGGNCTG